MVSDLPCPERGNRSEPEDHDRTEDPADAGRTALLHPEEPDKDRYRQRHDGWRERCRRDAEAFDGAEHRDCRGDDAVAIEQGCPEDHETRDDTNASRARFFTRRHEGQEGQDSPFAAVVGAHDERQVLHRDDHHQRPKDERQNAHQVRLGRGDPVARIDALLDGVERARADVAEDHARRHQSELAQARVPAGVDRRGRFDSMQRCRPRREGRIRVVISRVRRFQFGSSGIRLEVSNTAATLYIQRQRESIAGDAATSGGPPYPCPGSSRPQASPRW